MAGTWLNNDGLYLKYGTTKTIPTTAGDFKSFGSTRVLELTIDLTTLTTSAVIQADTTFFGTNMFIEQVDVDTEVGATGGTSFSVGLVQTDRSTAVSTTEFLAAVPIADHTTAGQKKTYTVGVTGVGAGVGTTAANPGYITALAAGTYTLGKVKIRIYYRGYGTITQ